MANYDKWLSFSELSNMKNMPAWMKQSLSGEYFSKRLKSTFTGELTPQEIKEMDRLSKVHTQNINAMSKQIEQKFKDLGY